MNELIEITPPEAWKMLSEDSNVTLIDVRSRMEFDYVGHAISAFHIPWAEPPEWVVTEKFVDLVRGYLQQLRTIEAEQVPVLVICRSGQRSRVAGQALLAAGFTQVYNILEGFEGDKDDQNHRNSINGWRVHDLPWEQS